MSEAKARSERRRARWRPQPRQWALLLVVWLVLWGDVNVVTVLGGVLVAWLVTALFPLPPVHYAGHLHPLGLLRLVAHLLKDLAVSSVELAAFAFSRRMPLPGIIRIDLRTTSDLYQVNIAELVSVVPGTIVVDARRSARTLYLHVFDLRHPEDADEVREDTRRLEERVLAAFGSREEQRALSAAGPDAGERTEGER